MPDRPDYYQILGADRNATESEIKEAFRFKAQSLHPDKFPEKFKHRAGEEFKQINEAYSILGDRQKRDQYNLEWDTRNQSHDKGDSGKQIIKPVPTADPHDIRFKDAEVGETRRTSFIIKNFGGPYTKISISNPDSWIKVVDYTYVNDYDQLPLRVEIEAKGDQWDNSYQENIIIKLDEEQTTVRVELRTKQKSTSKQNNASNTRKSPPQSRSGAGKGHSRPKSTKKDTLRRAIIAVTIIAIIFFIYTKLSSNNILIINTEPDIVSLNSNPSNSQVAGLIVNWTIKANDPENDVLLYKFLLKGPSTGHVWHIVADWSKNDSWTWITSKEDIGENQLKIQLRDGKHSGIDGFDAEKIIGFTIAEDPPVLRSIVSSLSSPQASGSDITWTANAYDPAGGRLYYRFSIFSLSPNSQRVVMTDWSEKSEWTWETKPSDVGDYQIYAEAKGENSLKPTAYGPISFTLTNAPPDQLNLWPDKASPQVYDTTINWKADASDANGDRIYYRFLLKGPSTNNRWQVKQDWSIRETWVWRTSSRNIGDNIVMVQVRDAYQSDPSQFDAEEISSYVIVSPPPSKVNSTQLASSGLMISNRVTDNAMPSSALNQPEIQNQQRYSYTSAEDSSSELGAIQSSKSLSQDNKNGISAPKETQMTVHEDDQVTEAKQIGMRNEPRNSIHLGKKEPKKMIYLGSGYQGY